MDRLLVASVFKFGNIVFMISIEMNSFKCNFMIALRYLAIN